MKGGMDGLMKQAKQMQEQVQKAQEQLAEEEVTGQAGGGLVEVTMTCKYAVRGIHLDPSLLEDNDSEMLGDLLAAAMNDALTKVENRSQELLGDVAGGLGNLPGLGDMFK